MTRHILKKRPPLCDTPARDEDHRASFRPKTTEDGVVMVELRQPNPASTLTAG